MPFHRLFVIANSPWLYISKVKNRLARRSRSGVEVKGGPQAAIHVKGTDACSWTIRQAPPPRSRHTIARIQKLTGRPAALGVPLSRKKPWQNAKPPLTVMPRSRDSQSIGPSHVPSHACFSSSGGCAKFSRPQRDCSLELACTEIRDAGFRSPNLQVGDIDRKPVAETRHRKGWR